MPVEDPVSLYGVGFRIFLGTETASVPGYTYVMLTRLPFDITAPVPPSRRARCHRRPSIAGR